MDCKSIIIRNDGVKTIEEVLEKAFYKSGFIIESNFGDLKKSAWSRGSRTDKGVHASVNAISCKLNFKSEFYNIINSNCETLDNNYIKLEKNKIVNDINSKLDMEDKLKVFDLKLCSKKFDVKKSASSRHYEYILPYSILKYNNKDIANAEILEKVKTLCSKYLGSHNFHNYTIKSDPNDKSNVRYMMDIKVSNFELNQEYMIIKIHGQSFMYHQIRKMIGCLIQIFYKGLNEDFIANSYFFNKVNIWLAPSEGLLLDRINFSAYNNKEKKQEDLIFSNEIENVIEQFKVDNIYTSIIEEDTKLDIFGTWIKTIIEEEAKYN